MSNPEQYINNHLNTSVSKFAYAFSKAERFQRSKKIHTQVKYTLPSTFQKRGCSFGYGNKSDLVIKRCSPPPGSYQSQSDFNKSPKKRLSPSFGLSRDVILFGSYMSEAKKRAQKIPSPHRYDIKLPRAHIGGKIGIRIETEPNNKSRRFPGPGAYDMHTIDMGNSSSFILSKYKNNASPKYYQSKTIEINPFRNTRKIKFYEIQQRQFGKSKVSQFRNVSITSFGKQKKFHDIDKWKAKIPGSKYKIFSEFGGNGK